MAVSPGFRETARFQLRDLPLSRLRSRAVDGCKRGRSAQRYLVEPPDTIRETTVVRDETLLIGTACGFYPRSTVLPRVRRKDGLPIGTHIVARPHDVLTITVASLIEGSNGASSASGLK
jgi:hypothetical protein